MKNKNSRKIVYTLVLIIWGIIPSILTLFCLLYLFFHPIRDPEPSSNERIIEAYTEGLKKDSVFLNQVAVEFVKTKYKGYLGYNIQNSGGYHNLLSNDGRRAINLNDSFPKIREFIKKKYPDARDCLYDFNYKNGIVFISLTHGSLFNQNETIIWLIYTQNINNLKSWFTEYKIYSKDSIPIEPYNWLYQIDKNWYICSPDDWIGY